MNSGIYYLKFFDPTKNAFVEENNYFSISRFYNFGGLSFSENLMTPGGYAQAVGAQGGEIISGPEAAFRAGIISSGQATGIGFQVITTGVGAEATTRLLYGPSYAKPANNTTFTSDNICLNGLQFFKVAITGAPDITGYPVITGYYLELEANPLPGICQ